MVEDFRLEFEKSPSIFVDGDFFTPTNMFLGRSLFPDAIAEALMHNIRSEPFDPASWNNKGLRVIISALARLFA